MAFTSSAVPAAQLLAQGEDAPMVFAENILRGVDGFWSSDGTGTGSDLTDPSFPAYFASDGHQHFGTRRTTGTATAHYFVWQISSSDSFDSAYVKLIGSAQPTTVTLQIADNSAFSTNLVTVFSWTGPGGSGRYTGASGSVYTGTGWCRLVLNFSGLETAPAIGELVLCQRRQISRRPDQSTGYDDQPYGSSLESWSARGGVNQNYTMARGFSNFRGGFSPDGTDQHGLDDLATFRGIVTESDYLAYPVVWIDRPNTALDFACLGMLELSGNDIGLEMPYEGWALRRVSFRLTESSPFARRDNRASDT